MSIIDDMRDEADLQESENRLGSAWDLRRIADRLAAATVLVAVPDGEAIASEDAECNFIMRGGQVFVHEACSGAWMSMGGIIHDLNPDIFVQPVRLERWEK